MPDDDEKEARFVRGYAASIGLGEMSMEVLEKALGLDELTEEKLDAWFEDEVLGPMVDAAGSEPESVRVVQVPDDEDSSSPGVVDRALPRPIGQKDTGRRGSHKNRGT